MDWPAGFKDEAARKQLATYIDGMITAYEASTAEKFERYQLAQDVYDDKEVMSSLEFLPDYQPYQVPFLQIRVRSLVQNVCGGYTQMQPFWILKDGEDPDAQDAAEADLTKAFEMADFDLRVRQSGRIAALKCRGPMRLTYQTHRDDELGDSTGTNQQGDVNYSGLVIDAFKAERFVIHPSWVESPKDALVVGHWFKEMVADAQAKQEAGEYMSDIQLEGADDSGETDPDKDPAVTYGSEDGQLKMYDLLVRVIPPGQKKRRWYRVICYRRMREIMWMDEYNAPTPNYFCPTFESEVDTFFAEQTPATRNLELQALINDAISLKVFGGANTAFLTVLAAGFVGDEQTVRMGIGQLIGYKGNPTFTVLPTRFDPRAMESVANDVERFGDGVTGASQMAQGQQLEGDPTATEINAIAAGTSGALAEQRVEFGVEILRMAKHGLYLLCENWKEWSKFNKGAIKAKKAYDYKGSYTIETTGKSASHTPQAVIEKINALLAAAKQLEIPINASLMQLNVDELFNTIVNALQLHVSTAKLLIEQPIIPNELPTDPFTDPSLAAIAGADQPDPELLALLLEQLGAGGQPTGLPGEAPFDYGVGAAAGVMPGGGGALPWEALGDPGSLMAV